MTIAEAREKCKSFISKAPRDMLILAVLLLSSSASFGLGYLTGIDVQQESISEIGQSSTPKVGMPTGSVGVIASKFGTKYYFPSCAGANRISEANKVWFATPELATEAGYALAANCK